MWNHRLLFPSAVALLLAPAPGTAAREEMPVVLSARHRAAIVDRFLEIRYDTVLPELMRRENIDMWFVVGCEYNEDPVIETMLPATWLAAPRRTVLVFDRGPHEGVERLAIARYDMGSSMRGVWDPESEPDQWKRLAEVVTERNPRAISTAPRRSPLPTG